VEWFKQDDDLQPHERRVEGPPFHVGQESVDGAPRRRDGGRKHHPNCLLSRGCFVLCCTVR
jgi:hypothetical protein